MNPLLSGRTRQRAILDQITPAQGSLFTQPRRIRRAAHSPGLAIVVVVSLMALLMLLVLAFLLTSSTNRNISSTDVALRQADSLADVAKETFIADLLGEMRDGSQNIAPNAEGTYAFGITNPRNMVPTRSVSQRLGTDIKYRSIVKQSADGVLTQNLGRNGVQRASDISTNQPDLDGRFVAPERWSAPKFLAPGVNLTANQVPDWIYTTRSGTNPTRFAQNNSQSVDSTGGLNPDYIIGRYAYQVYDVSGLLDANVVGNDSTPPPLGVLNRKGSLVWADLSTLPSFSGNPGALGDWRRISSKNWPRGISASSVEDFIREWGQENGWMKNPVANNNSDNLFLTRKDLIAYQRANPNVIPETALPFLTTTTRALNSPSWAPSFDAGNGFQYLTNKDNPNAVNRRIAGVLVNRAFTRRDGTEAKPGEPLVKSRFPLSKLRAFEAPQNPADIRRYFGLSPVSGTGNTTWQYVERFDNGGDSLLPLEKIAAENREPNFFELLNAGLLEGSLANAMQLDNGMFQDIARDRRSAYQVLRIGACIIDQWDRNDDPTIIQNGAVSPTGTRIDDAAGVENLPYFHMLGELRFRRGRSPNDMETSAMMTFQLWNPHVNPVNGQIASGNFRIATEGETNWTWNAVRAVTTGGYTDVPPHSTEGFTRSDSRSASMANDYISFNVSDFSTSFSNPTYLRPGVAGATASNPAKDVYQLNAVSAIGHEFGRVTAPYDAAHPPKKRYGGTGSLRMGFTTPVNFALQKQIGGVWVTYQLLPLYTFARNVRTDFFDTFSDWLYTLNGAYPGIHHGLLTDPRTTRYGISFCVGNQPNGDTAINKTTLNLGYDHRFEPPPTWTTPGPKRFVEQFASNAPGGATVTIDRDGRRRPTDDGSPFITPNQRPEILNRPFQSISEMGQAFRDVPWTTLNLFGDPQDSTNPGDGALLDLFSLTETPIQAGVVNLNSAPVEVLEALLSQTSIRDGAGATTLTASQAQSFAEALRNQLDQKPMLHPGEIATLAGAITRGIRLTSANSNKDRHVIARALADVANTRTWNLCIDVIAQSGRISPTATGLQSFTSQGERRVWYQLSIDRITGEIISLQKEFISE